ncbi:hypothetical protein F441_01770 [Phytophthora nicotianae CJ01A1]|uniref:DDE-1 domain-containing protein n=5 Tax=Phytophthora nicotianae TaxID=4792 RepID=W2QR62_PHYN3|nr:hypothetical protein PPTG_21982 [Phytophthora nicotianae INRA-310]ETK95339.1 hypothetical protein L915_01725 [Phytophthora nicotianae]ETO84273.1 hypothetical protein F444_01809 [Phytophthora nicotianae P1976]ETP25346.1 hypothetical protein F441_01770 [Phytophthora nicotianae CJ01A1]ETP53339.1 hypothetical protein F442_01745 [Phytophthora nicotianae P10297]ETL48731.1 hypothetical protein L916_01699 [Phytophthora nicotianae]
MDSIGTRTVWDCNSGKEKTRVTSTLLADPRANPDIPVLLIWDVFSGHWTSECIIHVRCRTGMPASIINFTYLKALGHDLVHCLSMMTRTGLCSRCGQIMEWHIALSLNA